MPNFKTPVLEYTTSPILGVSPGASALEAERLITSHEVSALGVLDAGALVGVISRTDLIDAATGEPGQVFGLPDVPVRSLMTASPITVAADAPLDAVARVFLRERIHRVFVERDGAPFGVCSTRDLMRAVHDARVTQPAIEIATTGIVRVEATDSLSLAVSRLEASNKQGLVVVDEGWPVGTFSQLDALYARARDPRTSVEEVMSSRVLALPPSIPLHRAARQALALNVRRILLVDEGAIRGIVSTFDFARVMR
ncbi:MAG: CBS domain-containing protein [Sandaracinaceae bacterium]|nr:CBS domain-containing protein [Sandaracinaceae bacterium]